MDTTTGGVPEKTRTLMETTARLFAALTHTPGLPPVHSYAVDSDPSGNPRVRLTPGVHHTGRAIENVTALAVTFGGTIDVDTRPNEIRAHMTMPVNSTDTMPVEAFAYVHVGTPQLLVRLVDEYKHQHAADTGEDSGVCPTCRNPVHVTPAPTSTSGPVTIDAQTLASALTEGLAEHLRAAEDPKRYVAAESAAASGDRAAMLAALFAWRD